MVDLATLMGLVVSCGGVLQSAWYNEKSKELVDNIYKIKEKLEGLEEFNQKYKYLSGNSSILLKKESNKIPSFLLPIDRWANKLTECSQVDMESGFIMSDSGEKAKVWHIGKKYILNMIKPTKIITSINTLPFTSENNHIYTTAVDMLKKNELELAIDLFIQLINSNEANYILWRTFNNLAICYLKSCKYKFALNSIDQAFDIATDDDKSIIYYNKAVILYEMESFKEAVFYFEKSLTNSLIAEDAFIGMFDASTHI
ncbi:MAG: tetratricopeptide repeat protein [Nitrospirae bacterium]|nr:tetratricopeptide repeat protein [Nitrospirota bacterium]